MYNVCRIHTSGLCNSAEMFCHSVEVLDIGKGKSSDSCVERMLPARQGTEAVFRPWPGPSRGGGPPLPHVVLHSRCGRGASLLVFLSDFPRDFISTTFFF